MRHYLHSQLIVSQPQKQSHLFDQEMITEAKASPAWRSHAQMSLGQISDIKNHEINEWQWNGQISKNNEYH